MYNFTEFMESIDRSIDGNIVLVQIQGGDLGGYLAEFLVIDGGQQKLLKFVNNLCKEMDTNSSGSYSDLNIKNKFKQLQNDLYEFLDHKPIDFIEIRSKDLDLFCYIEIDKIKYLSQINLEDIEPKYKFIATPIEYKHNLQDNLFAYFI